MLASQVSELRQFHRMNSEIWRFCPRIVERLRIEAATYMETNHREVLNEGFVVQQDQKLMQTQELARAVTLLSQRKTFQGLCVL